MDEISDQEAYHITNNRTYGDIVDPRFAPGVWAKAPAPTPSQFGDYKVARQKCWGDWNRASSVRDVRRAKISRDARGALFRGYASKVLHHLKAFQ